MKYTVIPGTETFLKLSAVAILGNAYKQQADNLVIAQGAVDYCESGAYGGVRGMCFDGAPPAGYVLVAEPDFYYPADVPAHAELRAQLAALPIMSNAEFSAALGYRAQHFLHKGQPAYSGRPGVEFGVDFILVDIPEGVRFEPGPDLVAISEEAFLAALPKDQAVGK